MTCFFLNNLFQPSSIQFWNIPTPTDRTKHNNATYYSIIKSYALTHTHARTHAHTHTHAHTRSHSRRNRAINSHPLQTYSVTNFVVWCLCPNKSFESFMCLDLVLECQQSFLFQICFLPFSHTQNTKITMRIVQNKIKRPSPSSVALG